MYVIVTLYIIAPTQATTCTMGLQVSLIPLLYRALTASVGDCIDGIVKVCDMDASTSPELEAVEYADDFKDFGFQRRLHRCAFRFVKATLEDQLTGLDAKYSWMDEEEARVGCNSGRST
jgi:hypothetical protein